MVGSLRAECNRLGITDMQITVSQARLSPIELKLSESMRLKRLARDAILKEDQRQLVVSIPRTKGGASKDPATFLVGFLRELIPP